MREAHLKFHMKYPRYEVDSTCLSSRYAVLANERKAMYISICLHDYDSKDKEILYLTATQLDDNRYPSQPVSRFGH